MISDALNFSEEQSEGTLRAVLVRRRKQQEVDLDITPMIDITFLLLIFFLVASTSDDQARVDLPKARYGVGVSANTSIFFTITQGGLNSAAVYQADGKIVDSQLGDDPQQQNNQIENAVAAAVGRGLTNVVIKAERGVPHREVARVAAAASRVARIKIFLAVLEAD